MDDISPEFDTGCVNPSSPPVRKRYFVRNRDFCWSPPPSVQRDILRETENFLIFFLEIAFFCKNTSKMCYGSWMSSIIIPRSFSRLFKHIIYLFSAFKTLAKKKLWEIPISSDHPLSETRHFLRHFGRRPSIRWSVRLISSADSKKYIYKGKIA